MEPKRFPVADIAETLELLPILDVGSCEPLKAAVHSAALGLCALMGLYNAAAWLKRRQTHLAINAVIYLAATYWEHRHVAHHVVCFKPSHSAAPNTSNEAASPMSIEPRAA
ncbi:MAG: hypothetical protein WBC51_15405 [Vicinamibacterales bacterium]|jgi:hypothetical protein